MKKGAFQIKECPFIYINLFIKNAKFKSNAPALFLTADFLLDRDRYFEQHGQHQKPHGPDPQRDPDFR